MGAPRRESDSAMLRRRWVMVTAQPQDRLYRLACRWIRQCNWFVYHHCGDCGCGWSGSNRGDCCVRSASSQQGVVEFRSQHRPADFELGRCGGAELCSPRGGARLVRRCWWRAAGLIVFVFVCICVFVFASVSIFSPFPLSFLFSTPTVG